MFKGGSALCFCRRLQAASVQYYFLLEIQLSPTRSIKHKTPIYAFESPSSLPFPREIGTLQSSAEGAAVRVCLQKYKNPSDEALRLVVAASQPHLFAVLTISLIQELALDSRVFGR